MKTYSVIFTDTDGQHLVFAGHSKNELTEKVRSHIECLMLEDPALKTDLIADADLELLCDWMENTFGSGY